ncbi:CBS domain-containing protein [Candidatus Bathyarchaeota archaeon]|nr:CBS domain-containing protein [Candidatus Bathyarchaeota archaeon]MBS7629843.1 CBS domain-containing protein [Candidatus Bathyarchaeota archaeon]
MSEKSGSNSKHAGGLVEEIMNRNVLTIQDSASIGEAARLMRSRGVGCLIVKRGRDLHGIVTERDLVKALADDRLDTTVGEVASKPLVTIGPKNPISEAAKILASKGIRRLPVVEGEELTGILTSTDLLRYYAKLSKYTVKNIGP